MAHPPGPPPPLLFSFIRTRLVEHLTRIYCVGGRGRRSCLGVFGGRKRASAADVEPRVTVSCWASRPGRALVSHLNLLRCAFNLPRKKDNNLKPPDIILFSLLPSSSSFILFFCTVSGSSVESKETNIWILVQQLRVSDLKQLSQVCRLTFIV